MSTKSTIALTGDNEHFYFEHSERLKDGKPSIVLEFDLKRAEIISFPDDKEDLIIQLTDPESDIYRIFELIGDKKWDELQELIKKLS